MAAPSTTPRRTLVVLCVASIFWAFSFGVSAPLASLWLKDAGCSATVIGLNTSLYYLGITLAAGLVPSLMRRWGNRCAIFGTIASGVTVALFPLGMALPGWHLLRLLNGFAGAMSLIPLESRVNHNATPEQRARHFGCYAFSIALGMALGTLVGLQMYGLAPRLAFMQGGLLAVAAGVVVLEWLPAAELLVEELKERTSLEVRRNFLSFGSAWSQGFLEGGMVALLPIYLLAAGMTENGVSWLLSGIMIGVITFQVPVAWLADRFGRTTVLVGCYVVAGAGLLVAPFCGGTFWLTPWLFLVGACSGAFYPLGLSILGERLPNGAIPRANAWYLAINCIGSLIGPALIGAAMDLFGQRSMFAVAEAALLSVLVTWAALEGYSRWQRRPVVRQAAVTESGAVAQRAAA